MSLTRVSWLFMMFLAVLADTARAQRTARRPLLAAPSGPATFSAASSSGGAQLSWTGVDGVSSYQVLRGSDSVSLAPVGSPVEATSYVDPAVPPGTTVFYRVAALYPDGRQGLSSAVLYTSPVARAMATGTRTDLRTPTAPAPGTGTLNPIAGPTRPAPTGLVINSRIMLADLYWPPVSGATEYVITRTDAAGTTLKRTPDAFAATAFTDTVPDPRLAYTYRLSAFHPDGSWGQSSPVSYMSPPPINPKWLRAALVPGVPGAVDLTWERPLEAPAFLVSGAGLPDGAKTFTGDAIRIFNVPRGPRAWRVSGFYPGSFADSSTAPTATAIVRTLPPHSPAYLRKPTADDYDVALHHAGAFRAYDQTSRKNAWSYIENELGRSSFKTGTPAKYENVTDLAKPRQTECDSFVTDKKQPRTVCWSMSGPQLTMIVAQPEGMQFAAWHFEGDPDFLAYESLAMFSQVLATKLDSEGDKLLPFSCMSCHGGEYDPQTKLVKGATLLPVDPSLVRMDPSTTPESVRRINETVFLTTPSASVRRYIHGLYGGRVAIQGALPVTDYAPQSWQQQHRSFYLDVVRKNCVMCHLNGPPSLDFTESVNFFGNKDLVYAAVCGSKSMPHAEPAFNRFWMEDTGNIYVPGLLAALLGRQSCE